MNTSMQRFSLIYKFVQINKDQFNEVIDYRQINFDCSLIPYYAKISKNREFNNSNEVVFWYNSKEKDDKNWSKVIGLKRSKHSTVFFGDIPKVVNGNYLPQHFLMFVFSDDFQKLAILLFLNFYPNDENTFIDNYIKNFK